jgi:hypothetical protein
VLITGQCRPARLDLRHDPAEGFGLVLRIRAGLDDDPASPPATWRFSRDLLDTGLTVPTGTGDVRVRPLSEDWTLVELVRPRVAAILVVGTADLRGFLAETYRLTPHGAEQCAVDWDEELRALDG